MLVVLVFMWVAWGNVVPMAAGVTVRDQSIHHIGYQDTRQEASGHQGQAADVETVRPVHAFEGFMEKPQSGGGQHKPGAQAKDAVIGAARELPNEEKWKGANPGQKAGQGGSCKRLQHGRAFLP
jgi:hypothetical protein